VANCELSAKTLEFILSNWTSCLYFQNPDDSMIGMVTHKATKPSFQLKTKEMIMHPTTLNIPDNASPRLRPKTSSRDLASLAIRELNVPCEFMSLSKKLIL
jgi:hypothetical protein